MKTTLVHIVLRLDSDTAIRAPEAATDETNLPVARDGNADFHVPGTSVAGSLRAHLGDAAEAVMGGAQTVTKSNGRSAFSVSPLRVLGTTVRQARSVRRSRTAIDRHRAAAAANTLWDTEALAAGAEVAIYLRLDDTTGALWPSLSARLPTWTPRLGGGRSIGQGRTSIRSIRHGTLDLSERNDLELWLTHGGTSLIAAVATSTLSTATTSAPPSFHSTWVITHPVHVGVDKPERTETSSINSGAPAPTMRGGDGRPLVPASSWKGVLRSRCEWILAELGARTCIDRRCGTCGTCQIFGWSARAGASDEDSDRRPTGGRAKVEVSVGPVVEPGTTERRTHVALDRVHGGATDKLLFTLEAVPAGRFTLTLTELNELDPWMHALIRRALRDIHDGYVGIGAATTRGYGTIVATDPGALEPDEDQTLALMEMVMNQTDSIREERE